MYIPSFLAGILATLFVEILIFVIIVIVIANNARQ